MPYASKPKPIENQTAQAVDPATSCSPPLTSDQLCRIVAVAKASQRQKNQDRAVEAMKMAAAEGKTKVMLPFTLSEQFFKLLRAGGIQGYSHCGDVNIEDGEESASELRWGASVNSVRLKMEQRRDATEDRKRKPNKD
jgi:hypothetical protein